MVPGSHISPKLEEYFSDIIYACKFDGQETLLSLLLEHKSAVPKFPHLQLLRYMLELWEKEASEKENTVLRPIIPIIVYHGKRAWKKKLFYDSFPTLSESLRSFIPAFEYLLTDLRNWSDEGLRVLEAEILKKTLLLFKHYGEDEYVREHFQFLFTFRDANVEDEQIRSIIISFFVYLTLTTKLEREEFVTLIRKLPSTNTELNMTLYEKIKLAGSEEGKTANPKRGNHQLPESKVEPGNDCGVDRFEYEGSKRKNCKAGIEFLIVSATTHGTHT